MDRRGFLGSILALAAAPAIVRAESIMRVRPIIDVEKCSAMMDAMLRHHLDATFIAAVLYGANGPIAYLSPDERGEARWEAKSDVLITDVRLRFGGAEIQHPAMAPFTAHGGRHMWADDTLTISFPDPRLVLAQ